MYVLCKGSVMKSSLNHMTKNIHVTKRDPYNISAMTRICKQLEVIIKSFDWFFSFLIMLDPIFFALIASKKNGETYILSHHKTTAQQS